MYVLAPSIGQSCSLYNLYNTFTMGHETSNKEIFLNQSCFYFQIFEIQSQIAISLKAVLMEERKKDKKYEGRLKFSLGKIPSRCIFNLNSFHFHFF